MAAPSKTDHRHLPRQMPQRAFITLETLTPLQSLISRRWRPQWTCPSCRAPPRRRVQQQHDHQHVHHQNQLRRTFTTTAFRRHPADEPDKPYYVTTPIFYVNAAPHVGHMYTMILADVLKRWQDLKGRAARLTTGTDEHGMKVQRAAAAAGVEPQRFCDAGAQVFVDLARRVGISHDVFVRTTAPRHKEAVEHAWHVLSQRGYVYERKHEGWYSVSDETFYPASKVRPAIEPMSGRKMMASVETGKEVEWTQERNYHFRLSAFRDSLLEHYRQNPDFIRPASKMDEVVQEVTDGLEDLSISRPHERLSWGVPVPTDPSQTIYVWIDALLNYASAAGYPFAPRDEHAGGWPADIHVVGKDIVRFHCIYWPALLQALGLPLPRQILSHAHWTLGKAKMAKSTGNVVSPFYALDRFGVDVMRWYLVHDGGIADDADYDNLFIIQRYKKGLQGGLGNLASRVLRAKGWDVARAVRRYARTAELAPDAHAPVSHESDAPGRRMYGQVDSLAARVDGLMRELMPNKALQALMKSVHDFNGFLQHAAPWNMAPDDPALDRVIYMCAENLRLVGIMLQPFIPDSASRLLDMLGVEESRRGFEWCRVGADDSYGVLGGGVEDADGWILFPRLSSER